MKELPSGILPPLVTTFRKDCFDAKAYAANIQYFNTTSLAGYVVLGSNGESVYLSDIEAIEVVETAAAAREEDKTIIVGTGRESTKATIDFTKRSARAGADAALVVPPSYYRSAMTESALEFHFRSVADASDIPILLYHVPKFCPVSFEPKLVHSLSSHPNIVGMKDTSADMVFLTTCLKERSDGFKIYVGTANILLAGLVLGADGGVLALANIAPQECVSLYGMVERGELEAARKVQYRLLPVNQAVTSRFGIAGLKLAIDSIGLQGGEARRPIEPLSRNEEEELQAILRAGAIQSVTAEKN